MSLIETGPDREATSCPHVPTKTIRYELGDRPALHVASFSYPLLSAYHRVLACSPRDRALTFRSPITLSNPNES